MDNLPEWMPVFMVVPATSEVSVAHGDRKGGKKTKTGSDFWQRIGTAYTGEDGTIRVHLTAVPINGKLVIRPPRAGERLDPTTGSR